MFILTPNFCNFSENLNFSKQKNFCKIIPFGLPIIVEQFFKALCFDSYFHAFVVDSKVCWFFPLGKLSRRKYKTLPVLYFISVHQRIFCFLIGIFSSTFVGWLMWYTNKNKMYEIIFCYCLWLHCYWDDNFTDIAIVWIIL